MLAAIYLTASTGSETGFFLRQVQTFGVSFWSPSALDGRRNCVFHRLSVSSAYPPQCMNRILVGSRFVVLPFWRSGFSCIAITKEQAWGGVPQIWRAKNLEKIKAADRMEIATGDISPFMSSAAVLLRCRTQFLFGFPPRLKADW